jgi:RNA polymerase sigma factor (TIGR02999 family)
MERENSGEVTRLLKQFQGGESAAADQLIELVYPELRRMAGGMLRGESPGRTLQPTALVNEAYMKLVDQRAVDWQGRTHFFSLSARLMRRILIDHARERLAQKRGGADQIRVTLGDDASVAAASAEDLIAVSEALDKLQALDERQAKLVELRFFGGLKLEEAAEAMGVSLSTAKRDWNFAKAWLRRHLTLADGSASGL